MKQLQKCARLMLMLGGSMAAFAHHSFAVFDTTREVSIEGTVKQFSYTNPHIWIDVEVANGKGGSDLWGIETGPPSQQRRLGWTPDILKPGDKVKATLHPRRDGTHAGSIVTLAFADGTMVGQPRNRGPASAKPPNEQQASADRSAGDAAQGAHPLLVALVPQLKFGFYHQPVGQPESAGAPPSADARNFAGRYFPNEGTLLLPGEAGTLAPYNDAGARLFLGRARDFIAGKLRADPLSLCKPGGVVRAMNQGFPTQITQSADLLTLIFMEDHLVRRIYLNPATAPRDPAPSYMGYSVGHWEGDTLVVDTSRFRDGGWMDEYGSPSSDQLHLTERISKQSDGTLNFDIHLEDPKYYQAPMQLKRSWKWQPTVSWDEVICEENNRDAPVK
ncbi:MAG: DUF6152 family protein [Steroidobacteraceae bacterium]